MRYCLLAFVLVSQLAFAQQISPNDALGVAASANDVEGITRALERGAYINSTTFDGKTPLIRAAFLGHIEAVQVLIERKADLNHRDSTGETALMYAAGVHPQIAIKLIKTGADLDIKDNSGRTALMSATNPEVKKLIKDAGGKEIKWVAPGLVISSTTPVSSAAARGSTPVKK